jgi:hypothetical protein
MLLGLDRAQDPGGKWETEMGNRMNYRRKGELCCTSHWVSLNRKTRRQGLYEREIAHLSVGSKAGNPVAYTPTGTGGTFRSVVSVHHHCARFVESQPMPNMP